MYNLTAWRWILKDKADIFKGLCEDLVGFLETKDIHLSEKTARECVTHIFGFQKDEDMKEAFCNFMEDLEGFVKKVAQYEEKIKIKSQ